MASEDVSLPRREGRPRRVLPTYPDSPIVIPPHREEAARNALNRVNELWTSGKHLDALLDWFGLPKGA